MAVDVVTLDAVQRVVSRDDLLVHVGLGAALGGAVLQPLGKVDALDCIHFPVHVLHAVDLLALGFEVQAMLSRLVGVLHERCALDALAPLARLGLGVGGLALAGQLIVDAVDVVETSLYLHVGDLEHVAVKRVAEDLFRMAGTVLATEFRRPVTLDVAKDGFQFLPREVGGGPCFVLVLRCSLRCPL